MEWIAMTLITISMIVTIIMTAERTMTQMVVTILHLQEILPKVIAMAIFQIVK